MTAGSEVFPGVQTCAMAAATVAAAFLAAMSLLVGDQAAGGCPGASETTAEPSVRMVARTVATTWMVTTEDLATMVAVGTIAAAATRVGKVARARDGASAPAARAAVTATVMAEEVESGNCLVEVPGAATLGEPMEERLGGRCVETTAVVEVDGTVRETSVEGVSHGKATSGTSAVSRAVADFGGDASGTGASGGYRADGMTAGRTTSGCPRRVRRTNGRLWPECPARCLGTQSTRRTVR
mmetsp:Transcript_87125/g.244432  ORF Transcript_87125/g.244432 Transcript_87125/m.244432 type:complete len:240 (-) Transcript_87125:773-1492(-)